jgi:hypothetical protein
MDIMAAVNLQGSVKENPEAADRTALHNLVIEIKQLTC